MRHARAAKLLPENSPALQTARCPAGLALELDSHVGKRTLLIGDAGGFVAAFRSLRRNNAANGGRDVLRHIELPLPLSWVGVPLIGAFGVWMLHDWFGVNWVLGTLAIPMILVLAVIAASSTALTGITPSGSLSKIPQFTFGAIDPRTPAAKLMPAMMCRQPITR